MDKADIPKIKYIEGRERTTELVCIPGKAPFIRFIPFSNKTKSEAENTGLTLEREACDFVIHGFSTRLGGVSEGIFSSMNFASNRGDAPENILENFMIMGDALGVSPESMVYAKQTHTINVLPVNEYHKGMGVTRNRDFNDIDALVTDSVWWQGLLTAFLFFLLTRKEKLSVWLIPGGAVPLMTSYMKR